MLIGVGRPIDNTHVDQYVLSSFKRGRVINILEGIKRVVEVVELNYIQAMWGSIKEE